MRVAGCALSLALALACAAPVAHADPIFVSTSVVGSGTLGGRAFSDQRVTFTASLTTEILDACESANPDPAFGSCVGVDGALFPGDKNANGLLFTVTVGGLGTFGSGEAFNVYAFGNTLSIGDSDAFLNVGVTSPSLAGNDLRHTIPLFTGEASVTGLAMDDCGPYDPCHAVTTGGDLLLDSVAGTATGEVLVGEAVVTPEPGTWVMVGTGLLGGVGAVRRRFGR